MNHRTHCVGVGGFILRGEQMLFLKRNNEPRIWAPPGGRLNPGEDPVEGLRREIAEETRLQVEILSPISVWYDDYADFKLLAIFFLCRYVAGEIELSDESAGAEWLTLDAIKERIRHGTLLGKVEDYERAFKIFAFL
jgi:8-oxo-dGTP diphosphatase